jgi:hypothetical protein
MAAASRFAGDNRLQVRFRLRQNGFGSRTLSARRNGYMKTLTFAIATAVAAASAGLASLASTPVAMNQADCPYGWYWDDYRQNCLPPGLPKDPPNGCLTGSGTHANGTICIN